MACNLIAEASAWLDQTLPTVSWTPGWTAASVTAFALVAAAEFGDKSQLVCMTLAARHRHWPILWGAAVAFAILNALAVVFGAAAARWLPPEIVAGAVAVLFALFGIRALLDRNRGESDTFREKSGYGLFLTTFLMIFLSEFGDKTQIAVAGLSTAEPPVPVWLGATLALVATSALGIWAGRALLKRVSPGLMHRVSGLLFLTFAGFAAARAVPPESLDAAVRTVQRWATSL